jgi:diguanylate cyclase (GGDEF)-like protein/hemerythrin-like metal-binding protein
VVLLFGILLVVQHVRTRAAVRRLEAKIRTMTRENKTLAPPPAAPGPLRSIEDAIVQFARKLYRELADAEFAQSELEQLVSLDRLTGVGNRRHFEQQIELEAARGKRYRIPVSVALFDVDHFKRINDTFGHVIGDTVLVDITRRVTSQLRDTDTIARWGGEEFAVIAPCTPLAGAQVLAEKLRRVVAELPFDVVGTVTISVGVAQLLPGERAKHWVARADRFLYQAKGLGRNRVCAHPEEQRDSGQFVLVWGDQFVTGQPKVDAEHAELFHLANDIILLDPEGPPSAIVERFDTFLTELTAHFQSEEVVLEELGCSDHDRTAHTTNHQGLLRQALDLRTRLCEGRLALDEVADFIVRRIAIGHLVAMDLPLFHSLSKSETTRVAVAPPSLRIKLQRALGR